MADAAALARACADAMWADDRASAALGIEITDVAPGRAVASMTVRADMVNGHGMAHGGYVFTLADTAFAFACNTHGQRTVAAGAEIAFLAPAPEGARLRAEAVERYREGRSGICDVTVRAQDGTVVAEFRGRSRTIAGRLVPEGQGA